MSPELDQRLRGTVGAVLGLEPEAVTDDTSVDTVAEWDSLAHMNLILAIEEEFDVVVPDEEAADLTSYPLLRLVVREQLVARET
jgi:acyl carrier protein